MRSPQPQEADDFPTDVGYIIVRVTSHRIFKSTGTDRWGKEGKVHGVGYDPPH